MEDEPKPQEEPQAQEPATEPEAEATAPAPEPAPTPVEEPTPVVEATPPTEPKYTPTQVKGLISAALQKASQHRETTELEKKMDTLYTDDPAKWAEVRKGSEDLLKERANLKQEVAEQYYEKVFGALLPKYRGLLSDLSPEEKQNLNPDNPKYQDDAEYLSVLLGTIAEKQGEINAKKIIEDGVMARAHEAASVVKAHEQTRVPELEPATPTPSPTFTGGSHMANALKEVVGAGMDDDSD